MEFMSSSELTELSRDFLHLLDSPEAIDVEVHYSVPVGITTINPIYKDIEADSWTEKIITCRAIQQIVNTKSVNILPWGILEVGDCVFYFDVALDLTVARQIQNLRLICTNGSWMPVTPKMRSFEDYLVQQIGGSQVAQVIPAKKVNQ